MFWDRTVPLGKSKSQFMEWAIDQSQSVLVLWSAKSVVSNAVHGEAEDGLKRRALFAVVVDDAVAPPAFQRAEQVNLTGWEGDRADAEFQRLAAKISERIPRTRPAVPLPATELPAIETPSPAAAAKTHTPLSPAAFAAPEEKKSSMPVILIAGVAIAALAALLVWRSL